MQTALLFVCRNSKAPNPYAGLDVCLAAGKQAIAFEAASFRSPLTARGASLEFKGELKRWPILSMVCDKECLILLHRLRQFLKIGLSELSGQKICPALRMHSILHHPLVVIR
jgi:hypothetical protein